MGIAKSTMFNMHKKERFLQILVIFNNVCKK